MQIKNLNDLKAKPKMYPITERSPYKGWNKFLNVTFMANTLSINSKTLRVRCHIFINEPTYQSWMN